MSAVAFEVNVTPVRFNGKAEERESESLRMAPEQPVHLSRVEFDLEVEGREHGAEIIRSLQEAGIQVVS
mgnify:CR=1 FL=1